MSILIRYVQPPRDPEIPQSPGIDLASQHWVTTSDPDVYLGDGYSPIPEGATIITDDDLVTDLDEYLAIRPLGNIEGQATSELRYQHFMGEPQVLAGDPEAEDHIDRRSRGDVVMTTAATPIASIWHEVRNGGATRSAAGNNVGGRERLR